VGGERTSSIIPGPCETSHQVKNRGMYRGKVGALSSSRSGFVVDQENSRRAEGKSGAFGAY